MRAMIVAAVVLGLGTWAGTAQAVDINRASKSELMSIKGIGDKTASAIIESREADGPFTSLEDVANRVKGVGDKTIEKWRQQGNVTVGRVSAPGSPAETTEAATAPAAVEEPALETAPALVFPRLEMMKEIGEILRSVGYGNFQVNNLAAAKIIEYFQGKIGFALE